MAEGDVLRINAQGDQEFGSSLLSETDPVSGAQASVNVDAPEDSGDAHVDLAATDADGFGADIESVATTTTGAAAVTSEAVATTGDATVSGTATTADGTATARLDAVSQGGGATAAGVKATNGSTTVGIEAAVDAGGDGALVIRDGVGLVGEPGQYPAAHATLGIEWTDLPDQLTSAGAIVISAGGGLAVLTLGAAGSFSYVGDGGFALTMDAAGALETNAASVKLIGLPTADPVAANQLWNDSGTLKVSAG